MNTYRVSEHIVKKKLSGLGYSDVQIKQIISVFDEVDNELTEKGWSK